MCLKKLTFLLLISLCTSCGMVEDIAQSCGGDLDMACKMLFGHVDQRQDAQIGSITDRIRQMESELESFSERLKDEAANVDYLQAQAAQLAADIYELKGLDTIDSMIDPCGDDFGFDEVVLRSRLGRNVAYFEQGGKRFLTVLPPGSYKTTDGTNCHFTISNAGLVCDGGGCR